MTATTIMAYDKVDCCVENYIITYLKFICSSLIILRFRIENGLDIFITSTSNLFEIVHCKRWQFKKRSADFGQKQMRGVDREHVFK